MGLHRWNYVVYFASNDGFNVITEPALNAGPRLPSVGCGDNGGDGGGGGCYIHTQKGGSKMNVITDHVPREWR